MIDLTVPEIRRKLQEADSAAFAVLERSLVADTRKGVRTAVEVARRRLEAEAAEAARLAGMYAFERELAAERGGSVVIGLDEVGRGPLAGPLAVGGVVLNADDPIAGLNDSKQVRPEDREAIAEEVRRRARAWTVQYVEPADIDRVGMTAALRQAFTAAIAEVEAQGVAVDVVLLDGNPLHLDPREVNVVKGDGKCASIAAASLVAKVARDHVMEAYAEQYPGYGFESNKGYGSEGHMAAIRERGLCPIHRRSFCSFAAFVSSRTSLAARKDSTRNTAASPSSAKPSNIFMNPSASQIASSQTSSAVSSVLPYASMYIPERRSISSGEYTSFSFVRTASTLTSPFLIHWLQARESQLARIYHTTKCTSKKDALKQLLQGVLAGAEGIEPSAYGFGDRRSTS